MTETIFVAKNNKSETFSKEDLILEFKSNTDLDKIKSLVEKSEDRVFVAWSSVDAVDKAKERIPVEDLIRQMDDYMQFPAINDEHSNGVVGKCLAYKVMIHPVTKSFGILQLNEIFKRNQRENDVWKALQSGKKTGLSVGGIVSSKPYYETSEDGNFVKVLSGFQQYETSVVEDPCNQHALNEAVSTVAKSADTQEKMTEEIKQEPVVEATKEADVTKQDEENMKEEVSAEVSMEDVLSMVKTIMERLDELESAVSGKPESDAEEEKSEDEEEETEKEMEEEEKTEDEEEDKKYKSLESQVTKMSESIENLTKKFETSEVIKSERPVQEVQKKALTALDVARGKARVDSEGNIVARV